MLGEIRRIYRDRPLAEVTPASLKKPFSSKTPANYNRLLTIIRAAMNIACADEWVSAVPKFPKRDEPDSDPRFITAAEWARMRKELPEHLLPMADFAIATGLRWQNVTGLEWRRVDLERALVWVPPSQTKAGKMISIPLSAEAIKVLKRIPGEREGFVFTQYHGNDPIKSPKSAWLRARTRAGLPNFKWHDLRHTWASWHVQAGTPLAVLQKLGGWASIEMVLKYAFLNTDHSAQYANNSAPARPKLRQVA